MFSKKEKKKKTTRKTILSSQKKFLSEKKKLKKKISKLEQKQESFLEESKSILSLYPITEHKNVARSVLSFKHLGIRKSIELQELKETIVDENIKIIGKFLSSDSTSPKFTIVKNVKIEEEETGENQMIVKRVDENQVTLIISMSIKEMYSTYSKINDLKTSIKNLRIYYLSEYSKLKNYPLLKTSDDIKRDQYLKDLRSRGFDDFIASRSSVLLEEFIEEFRIIPTNDQTRSEKCVQFNDSLRQQRNNFPFFLFQELKDHYEERIYVHIIHKDSRVFKYLKSHVLEQQRSFNVSKTAIIHPSLFKSFLDIENNKNDRIFLSLIQNCAMNRVIKQNLLNDLLIRNEKKDYELFCACKIMNERIDFFFEKNNSEKYNLHIPTIYLCYEFPEERRQELEIQENRTFSSSIETLKLLRMKFEDIYDPMEILLIIKNTCSKIGLSARRNCLLNDCVWEFGADDLFPIVSYLLIRSEIPNLFSLLEYGIKYGNKYSEKLYQDFINERMSELYYFVTVFDAVSEFIVDVVKKFMEEENLDGYFQWVKCRRSEIVKRDSRSRGTFLAEMYSDFRVRISDKFDGKGKVKNIVFPSLLFLFNNL